MDTPSTARGPIPVSIPPPPPPLASSRSATAARVADCLAPQRRRINPEAPSDASTTVSADQKKYMESHEQCRRIDWMQATHGLVLAMESGLVNTSDTPLTGRVTRVVALTHCLASPCIHGMDNAMEGDQPDPFKDDQSIHH